MGGSCMSKYFLVAHNSTTGDYRILPLMSKWYRKDGNEVLTKENSLEAIDLVTSRFSSAEVMAKRLCANNYIPSEDYEFFVVSRSRKNKQDVVHMHEVFYNEKPERTEYFRTIALESLNKDLKGSSKNIRLFDRFLNKMYYNADYYQVVKEGLSGVPNRVFNIYEDCNKRNTPPYFLKYQNAWMMQSYGISRSIVGSFQRFDKVGSYQNHLDYLKSLSEKYASMKDELLKITSPEYLAGQLTLDLTIPREEKVSYTLRTFREMDRSDIKCVDNKYYFDSSRYDVSDKEKKKLKLSQTILKRVYWYLFHKEKMNEQYSYGGMCVLQEDMDADYRDIQKSLSKETVLDSAYQFCLLYNNCKDKQKVDEAYQKGRGTR